MTLSNIFFGKKVVQQAYLNNALIYQSKGWETLPSTCTEVWTKSYDITFSFNKLVSDLDNNIYALSNDSLYKFDPDGAIVWQKKILSEVKSSWIKCLKLDNINNTIFIMRKNTVNGIDHIFIDEFTKNGSVKNEYDITEIYSNGINGANDYAIDDKFIYLSVYYYDYSNYTFNNYYLIKIDRLEKKVVQIVGNTYINNNCLVSYKKYLYAAVDYNPINPSSGMSLRRFNKEDLTDSVFINSWIDTDDTRNIIKYITTDKLDNIIYKTNRNGTIKYNIDSKTKTALPISNGNDNSIIHVDYQQNIYVVEFDSSIKSTNLLKISSDNTLIYKIPIKDAVNPIFTVDYQGNIYYNWDSSDQTYIKKLINIVKKGN